MGSSPNFQFASLVICVDFWCIVCMGVIVLLFALVHFFHHVHILSSTIKKSLVAIKKCKNLMMLQVFWILSWSVQLRESRLGIKQECAVGANQLVTEPHWVTESKARPATWASADSYHHHHTHGCPVSLTCAYCGIRWLKQHMLEI